MKVCVLGAGVVGMTTAFFLQRKGFEVVVVDRAPAAGLETSFANGGQLSYSYVAPLAGPGVLGKLPHWFFQDYSPVRFSLSADYRQWLWVAKFIAACTKTQSKATTTRLLELGYYSRRLLHQLVEEEALRFDYERNGKLVFYGDPAEFQSGVRTVDFQRSLGAEQRALSADECIALEPALAHLRGRICGGIYTSSEDVGDCAKFCSQLEWILRSRGVQFLFGYEVLELRTERGTVREVLTTRGGLDADMFVLATGVESALLLRQAGIGVPLWPLTGYSVTVPVARPALAPRLSITDFSNKIVYAPIGGRFRAAGWADIRRFSSGPEENRLRLFSSKVEETFPGIGDYGSAARWFGRRPATPKGAPILGRSPSLGNLLLNIGHGALGFTLACGTAKITADLASSEPTDINVDFYACA